MRRRGRRPGATASLRRRAGSERGSAAVELVILVPGLVMLLGLALAGGRVWLARGAVADAAYSAARSASLARSPAEAVVDGRADGSAALDTAGLRCHQETVVVDAAGFAVAVGSPATVTARVACTVDLSDVVVPELPGSMRLSAIAAAPLDTYRAR